MEMVHKKILIYIVTAIVLIIGAVACYSGHFFEAMHSSLSHSLLQSIATAIAYFVGIAALYRYYKGGIKSSMLLFVGVAFIATGTVDTYHTIVTSEAFKTTFPNLLQPTILRWSWLVTRLFLSALLLVSLIGVFSGKENQPVNEKLIYTFVGVLTIVTLLFFSTVPINFPMNPEQFISRPLELVPGFIFILALIGYLVRGRWKTDAFEHWMVLCLIASVLCQIAYMAESKAIFDTMYHAAHVIKIISYLMVYIGITAL